MPKMPENYDYLFELLLCGDIGVGKSWLVHSFVYNYSAGGAEIMMGGKQSYVCQVGSYVIYFPCINVAVNFNVKTMELRGKRIRLHIW